MKDNEKKKSKIILVSVLSAVLVIGVAIGIIALINKPDAPAHTHSYTTVKYDNDYHWNECECGEKSEREEHTFVNNECECGYKKSPPEHEHSYSKQKYDSINHWYECTCGEKSDIEQHIFNEEDKCECGYKKPAPDHVCSFDELKYNESTHWYECTCGLTNNEEAHKGGTATCTQKAVCTVCGQEYGQLKIHDYTELKYNENTHWYECVCGEKDTTESHKGGEATCKALAICSICGQSYGTLANHVYESGACKWCGEAEETEGDTYTRNGDIIYFGSYPQTEVTDTTTTSALLSTAGNPITSTSGWTSYNYYVESVQTDCMYYKDVSYNGEKYRGVYIKNYRPYYTGNSSSASYTYQDDNGYNTNTVYWFKYEPIEWSIVSEESGYASIVCNMEIDSQAYQDTYTYDSNTSEYYNNSTGTQSGIYANNYQYSTIRKWLNETFFETAFNSLQQAIIQTVEVDNSVESTGYGENKYVCENTFDKVWLLSYEETTTYFTTDALRQRKTTAYAQSQGALTSTSSSYLGNGYWWLRSPGDGCGNGARHINHRGYIDNYYYDVGFTSYGVVPALQIQL